MRKIHSLIFITVLAFALAGCSVVEKINEQIAEAGNICVAPYEPNGDATPQKDDASTETGQQADAVENTQNADVSETPLPETEPTDTAQKTDVEAEWQPEEEFPIPEDAEYCHFVKLGESCSYDLDGDGQPEEITVHATTEGQEDYPGCRYQLMINDIEYKDVFLPSYSSAYYCIIDFDAKNPGYHLAFQDYGMSSDFVSAIFEYSKGVLIETGTIPGVFDGFAGFGDTVCNGDGTISTVFRMSPLQTWYGKADFRLSDGMLDMVVEDYYEAVDIDCNYSVQTLKLDLPVYSEKSLDGESTLISAGSTVTLLGCDNGTWVKIKAQDENEYWFAVVIDGETVDGSDVFGNLFFAD